MKSLIPLLAIAAVTTVVAELEYKLQTEYSSSIICRGPDLSSITIERKVENLGLPILITVSDEKGHPVSGAYVALKRIGPDGGYQESDITTPESSRSDKNGNAVILHPNRPARTTTDNQSSVSPDEDDEPTPLCLLGAVTAVAEGYETAVLELEDASKVVKIPVNCAMVPRFTIVLRKKVPSAIRR